MSKANKLMFSITIFMFLLSTAFWVSSVGNEISTIVVFFSSSPDRLTVWSSLFTLFNALTLINVRTCIELIALTYLKICF